MAKRIDDAARQGRIDLELALSRALDLRRETLRRLEQTHPALAVEAGELLPSAALYRYVAAVKGILETLGPRVVSRFENRSPEDRAIVAEEVAALLLQLAELEIES